jgi:hypothetical protein
MRIREGVEPDVERVRYDEVVAGTKILRDGEQLFTTPSG